MKAFAAWHGSGRAMAVNTQLLRSSVLALACTGALIVAVESLVALGLLDPLIVPPPSAVTLSFIEGWQSGLYFRESLITVRRLFLGLLFATAVGVPLGMAMGLSRVGRAYFNPIVSFLFPLPVSSLIPIALTIFGLADAMYYSLVALATGILLTIASRDAVVNLDRTYIETARTFGLSRSKTFLKVVLPAVTPRIAHGAYTAFAIGVIVLMTAEIVVSSRGVGNILVLARLQHRVADMYAGIVLIGLLGTSLNMLTRRGGLLLARWESEWLNKQW